MRRRLSLDPSAPALPALSSFSEERNPESAVLRYGAAEVRTLSGAEDLTPEAAFELGLRMAEAAGCPPRLARNVAWLIRWVVADVSMGRGPVDADLVSVSASEHRSTSWRGRERVRRRAHVFVRGAALSERRGAPGRLFSEYCYSYGVGERGSVSAVGERGKSVRGRRAYDAGRSYFGKGSAERAARAKKAGG